MKKKIIIANWKMHLNTHQASLLVHRLDKLIPVHRDIEVVLAPSLLTLQPLSLEIDHRKFKLAAQNAFYKDEGAMTGEVSFTMLRDLVSYAIVGHSERRMYFGETLEVVREKVAASVRNGITPVICVGETHQERAAGETKQVLHDQITTALANVTSEDIRQIVIAYEPVWAISTFEGRLAKPSEVEKELLFIRKQVADLYGQTAAEDMRLIFGGSVDAHIARGYLELPECDGALVGAASLKHDQFTGIVKTAYLVLHEGRVPDGR